jgi:NAD(P)-dependent dehydrogenase (short-subunit alcohol dehydrogenase family)
VQQLAGKTAFITGGASGIGYGMARAFAAEGMRVAIADLNEADLSPFTPDAAFGVRVDVTDRDSVRSAVATAVERFGAIDVVCANAGIGVGGGGGGHAADDDYEAWGRVMAVNLDGVVNTVKETVPAMRERAAGGHVVITSSVAGITALPFEYGAYTTSKFAVRGFGESLRLSLAEEGIGVSILCPGLTDTGILDERHADENVEFERIDGAMDPIEVGWAVVRGIRANAPFIFSHGEFADEFQQLFDEIVAAVPRDQAVPADRAQFERGRRELCDRLRHLPAIG